MCATCCVKLSKGVFMLARIKYLSGDTDAAKSGARYCLGQDNAHVDAHLLMARINISQGNYRQADTDLQTARDYNFEVREYPMYVTNSPPSTSFFFC